MKNNFVKNIIGSIIIAVFYMIPATVQAQEMSGAKPSTGRSAGTTLDMNNNSFKAIQRIRNHIDKGEFERAERRANRFIRVEDRAKRSGMGKTDFYREAHNCLCLSLTGQGKIEEAMEACNTSLEHSHRHWESLKTRATLYYMTQDFPKSLEDFTMSLEYAPEVRELTDVLKQNIAVVRSKIQ